MPSDSQEHVELVVGSHEHSDEDGSWSHVHVYPRDVEHKHANRLSAHIVEDLPAADPQQLGVMAAKYCPTCGCAVMNEKVHLTWHEIS